MKSHIKRSHSLGRIAQRDRSQKSAKITKDAQNENSSNYLASQQIRSYLGSGHKNMIKEHNYAQKVLPVFEDKVQQLRTRNKMLKQEMEALQEKHAKVQLENLRIKDLQS